jgi:alkylation response protein AidB-like acyl-CoA dehydrogenase
MSLEMIDLLRCAVSVWLRPDYAQTRFTHLDAQSVAAAFELADAIGQRQLLPHARTLDANPPRLVEGRVQQPQALRDALQALAQAGFFAPRAAQARGGIALPALEAAACAAILASFDASVYGYCMLTQGAANLLQSFGNSSQQQRYLAALEAGTCFGTMCLSEPHAGSSVGDIKTSAQRLPDGRYRLRGSKMWISGCEHELSENIIHMVLARIEGAPAGTKGLSLFVVPRFHVDAKGTSDRSLTNGVTLVALNHKMGYRATVNGALNFGIDAPCVGELLGPENAGMACMFQMMNEARIAVGVGAAAIGWRGYQIARDYAAQRLQGRPIEQPDQRAAPVAIHQHADVRRMLLGARARTEAALALCLYGAALVDAEDDPEAHALLSLLTPMIKSWPSSVGLQANDAAIQVLGGAGYTEDWLCEKLYRDNRLNPIHEGTHGIQGLDLLLRKILGDGGAALCILHARVQTTMAQSDLQAGMRATCQACAAAIAALLDKVPLWTQQMRQDPQAVSAFASGLLDGLGSVVASWLCVDLALAAQRAGHPLAQRFSDNAQYLEAALLPAAIQQLAQLERAAAAWQQLAPDAL